MTIFLSRQLTLLVGSVAKNIKFSPVETIHSYESNLSSLLSLDTEIGLRKEWFFGNHYDDTYMTGEGEIRIIDCNITGKRVGWLYWFINFCADASNFWVSVASNSMELRNGKLEFYLVAELRESSFLTLLVSLNVHLILSRVTATGKKSTPAQPTVNTPQSVQTNHFLIAPMAVESRWRRLIIF